MIQYESEIEAGDVETKEHENTNTTPRRDNAGKVVDPLEIIFGGKIYYTQYTTITGEKKTYFMHDMHKLAVDVTFTKMVAKKDIKKNGERAV